MTLTDLTLISLIHLFLILLALNFQWSSKATALKAFQKQEDEDQPSGVIKVRDSIALHNLRLSKRDRE